MKLDKIVNNMNFKKEDVKESLISENKFNDIFAADVQVEEFIDNLDGFDSLNNFKIKIAGVGGAGCNVVKHLIKNWELPSSVEIFALNTDVNSIKELRGKTNVFLLGKDILKGAGSGQDPIVGKSAVDADSEDIKRRILKDANILFLVAGLGKGTGSGSTPEIARLAKEMGILTIAIVNLPSIYAEGSTVYKNALENLEILQKNCHSVTLISNDKILNLDKNLISFWDAFAKADQQVCTIINEVVKTVLEPTDINVDYADIKNFFSNHKFFMSEVIKLKHDQTNVTSIREVITKATSDTFSQIDIKYAQKVLINFFISPKTPASIVADTVTVFKELSDNRNLTVVYGVSKDENIEEIKISFLISSDLQSTINSSNQVNDIYSNHIEREVPNPKTVVIDKTTTKINGLWESKTDVDDYRNLKTKARVKKFSFETEDDTSYAGINSERLDSANAEKLLTKALTNVLNIGNSIDGLNKEDKLNKNN